MTENIIIMNREMELYRLLQINGGTFPTGGFSQSWGLETYVSEGIITGEDSFTEFLEIFLDSNIGSCEGPVIREAYRLTGSSESEKLAELEQLSVASKTTKESREAAVRMGKAFMRIMKEILRSEDFAYVKKLLGRDVSYPVAYGAACKVMGTNPETAIRAYVYGSANALVQSAVKLIPLGNTQAQKILYESAHVMDMAVKKSLETDMDDITNFCPGLDIASIRHETLPVRLYMS
jgi:urease accessory protein